MTNGANYPRGKLHHSPWHSDMRTSNQLNMSIGGHLLNHTSLFLGVCWRDCTGLSVGGSDDSILRFILGQVHQKPINVTPILFLFLFLGWWDWGWEHLAVIGGWRWKGLTFIGWWRWYRYLAVGRRYSCRDGKMSIGLIAVIHSRAITKWYHWPRLPFRAHSFVVDSFFQLWAVNIQ